MPVGCVEEDSLYVRFRPARLQYFGQRNPFPERIAHEASSDRIADATKGCELLDRGHRGEPRKRIGARLLHRPAYFQAPKLSNHFGINQIFSDAVKVIIWRNELYIGVSILCTVVIQLAVAGQRT